MYMLNLEKAEELKVKLPVFIGLQRKQGGPEKISALLIMLKPLTVDHSKLWKSLKEMGIPHRLTSLLRSSIQNQTQNRLVQNQESSTRLYIGYHYGKDDTTLLAEMEELKSPLMKMKEKSEKVGLKLNIQKNKIMAYGPITPWQIDGETM